MTVRQLIDKLAKYPPDNAVKIAMTSTYWTEAGTDLHDSWNASILEVNEVNGTICLEPDPADEGC